MTNNEINYCYTIFCKYFEGKTYKEVISNSFHQFDDHIIKLTLDHFSIHNSHVKFINDDCMFYNVHGMINLNLPSQVGDPQFESIKDFLYFFNITLKDIV